jgi:hypothetical protein
MLSGGPCAPVNTVVFRVASKVAQNPFARTLPLAD